MTTTRNMTRAALVAIVLAACAGCSSSSPLAPTTGGTSTSGGSTPADFHGQYSGSYNVTNCVADGYFVGFCEGVGFAPGTNLPIALSLDQNLSAVTGTVTLGSIPGTFQGTVSGNTLSGSAVINDIANQGVTLNPTIANWSSTISGSALSGGFTLVFRTAGQTGSGTVTATIAQLSR